MTKFDEVIDRKNTRSVKWDLTEKLFNNDQVLPMWVADMDFPTPDVITQALTQRTEHGIFGYTITDQQLHLIIQSWLHRRYQWDIETNWLTYSPGVVPSLHTIVEALTRPEEKVLIQTPVYPPFYDVVKKHNRQVVKNPLLLINDRYEIDFKDFEDKLKEGISMFILCNPHNPVGRVWSKDEVRQMADLCLEYDVTIVSDEIHADLVFPGHQHVPMASLSTDIAQATISCFSPSKTFNIAGLQASYVVTPDESKRKKIDQQFQSQGMNMLNTMGITAMEAALEHGEPWLEELLEVLEDNKNYTIETIHKQTDKIRVVEPEGTYLLWLDCRNMGLSHKELKHFMQEQAKVGLNDGASFGTEGEGFMRMNIACPRATLAEGIQRILQNL